MKSFYKILTVFLLIPLFAFVNASTNKISVKMVNQTYHNGVKNIVKADIFFKYDAGEMITHFYYPQEYVFITNSLGESKIYYPDKNEVQLLMHQIFSSKNNVLYFFITNQVFDLGIQNVGYTVEETTFDDNIMTTIWKAIEGGNMQVKKIKIIHKDGLPIYSANFDGDDILINKTYYTDFVSNNNILIPGKITEINYISDTDSIVSRITYSDLKVGTEANGEFFEYKIPDNAKIRE